MKSGKLTTYAAVGLVTIGFVLMFLAWNGAAEFDSPQEQFPYLLSGSAPGLGLVLTGLALAVVQELRRLVATIVSRLDRLTEIETAVEGAVASPAGVPGDGSHVVATATTFHMPSCDVISGRNDLVAMATTVAEERGLVACRICDPGAASAA